MTRKMYRCVDSQKLIDYICKRTESLVTKGDIFFTLINLEELKKEI